jgi:hypothetical protein
MWSSFFVNLPVAKVAGCVSRNENMLGLQHLYFINVSVGRGPPDRACVVHRGTNELFVE